MGVVVHRARDEAQMFQIQPRGLNSNLEALLSATKMRILMLSVDKEELSLNNLATPQNTIFVV